MKAAFSTLLLATGLLHLSTSCVSTEHEMASSTKDPRSTYVPPTGAGHRISNATVLNTVRASHSFSLPAVPSSASPPAGLDAQDWASLRTDPAAVGFDYPNATGSEQRLAYSRKLGRAVVLNEL